jgi:hypothetical protein
MIDIENTEFILGKKSSDYLQILVDKYSYPNSNDFWDGNWMDTKINIKAGAFIGSFVAQIRNVDFLDFNKGLGNLYNKLDGFANFNCLEDFLEIKIKGDGLGHFSADCIANDKQTISGNKLEFSLEFDQTEIISLTNMIDKILDKFPIKEIDQIKRNKNL